MLYERMRGGGLALFVGFLVVACGSTSDKEGGGDVSTVDGFISQLCVELSSCCAAAGLPSDGAQCRALYGAFLPRGGFNASAADGCLADIRAAGDAKCDGDLESPTCRSLFQSTAGTAQPGEMCEDDNDCASPAMGDVSCESDYSGGATVRKCQVKLPGVAGSSPCIATKVGDITFGGLDSAATGYVCDVADGVACDTTTKACKALSKVGEACSSSLYGCVADAFCDLTAGSCKPRDALGAACSTSLTNSSSSSCVAGAFCDAATSLCVGQLAAQASCTQDVQCLSDHCTNGRCEAATDLGLTLICGTN